MDRRVRLGAFAAVCASALMLVGVAPALAGNGNAGDVWVDNVGQPAGPGHEMDPHLACADINLWGSGLADSAGSYTIDGWPPSGSQEQDYGPSAWSYSGSGTQRLDVINVGTLIQKAIANGDAPANGQGFHFKLQFSQDPQKHKTFWVDCATPAIATAASSATVGQPLDDVATLTGGDAPTGTITWNIYAAGTACTASLGTVAATVNGDGSYTSPDFTPSAPGSYQWVASYSGDSQNLPASGKCNDPAEQSNVSKATPSIATTATSSMLGQPIHDVATLTGGDAPTGTITWNLYAAGTGCAKSLDTVTATVSGDGVYFSPDFTPASTGSYEWVASYGGDANNDASAASSCSDPNEQSTVGTTLAPAIALIKFESDGASGSLTHGPLPARQSDTIDYRMTVVNTGNTPLVITFSDPHCDAGTLSAPTLLVGTFDPATSTLSAGGGLRYTCTHVLLAGDAPQFTNTASVSGQPPSGPPVTASDSVVALLSATGQPPANGTSGPGGTNHSLHGVAVVRCGTGRVKTTRRLHEKTLVVCVPKKKQRHAKPRQRHHHSQIVAIRRTDPQFTG